MKLTEILEIIDDAFDNQVDVYKGAIGGKEHMMAEIERNIMTKKVKDLVKIYEDYPLNIETVVEKDVITISTSWNTYEECGEDSYTIDFRSLSIEELSNGHSVIEGDYDGCEELMYNDFDELLEDLNEKLSNHC